MILCVPQLFLHESAGLHPLTMSTHSASLHTNISSQKLVKPKLSRLLATHSCRFSSSTLPPPIHTSFTPNLGPAHTLDCRRAVLASGLPTQL